MRKLIIVFLLIFISGCDDDVVHAQKNVLSKEESTQLERFITRIKSEMIFMPAGSFLMGDFCSKMRNGGMFCSGDRDNKPVHEVGLSAYSISKLKITHEDYDFYLKIAGLPRQTFNNKRRDRTLASMKMFKKGPAIISWVEANNYCSWLKKQTGLNFSLPTEAQWEYAARNKGKFIIIATNDGTLRYNKDTGLGDNYATDEDREKVVIPNGFISPLIHFPVDKYPPSPAGLYGMADNGKEWVKDWYDPDWYAKSSRKDPQGPDKGIIKDPESGQYLKVRRGASNPSPGRPSGLTISRSYQVPEPNYPAGVTARCVVNEEKPLN